MRCNAELDREAILFIPVLQAPLWAFYLIPGLSPLKNNVQVASSLSWQSLVFLLQFGGMLHLQHGTLRGLASVVGFLA